MTNRIQTVPASLRSCGLNKQLIDPSYHRRQIILGYSNKRHASGYILLTMAFDRNALVSNVQSIIAAKGATALQSTSSWDSWELKICSDQHNRHIAQLPRPIEQ
jgi:hypothetical protein